MFWWTFDVIIDVSLIVGVKVLCRSCAPLANWKIFPTIIDYKIFWVFLIGQNLPKNATSVFTCLLQYILCFAGLVHHWQIERDSQRFSFGNGRNNHFQPRHSYHPSQRYSFLFKLKENRVFKIKDKKHFFFIEDLKKENETKKQNFFHVWFMSFGQSVKWGI